MLFLGTGAAELLPNPFCKCKICEHVRRHPEEMRRRSSFLYDAHTVIDFGPDTLSACHALNVDLSGLQDVLITHAHDDHFSLANLNVITMSTTSRETPFTVHISQGAWEYFCLVRKAVLDATGGRKDPLGASADGWYSFQPHGFFETFTLGEKTVFTVRGNHPGEGPNEQSVHYRITEGGKTLLYALDTGLYGPDSLEALSETPVDILIMDATFGSAERPMTGAHLNGKMFIMQVENLAKAGVVTDSTRVFATHINHKHDWTHADYQAFFDASGAHPVTVARDGMEIHW